MNIIDKFLNNITMYRLTLYGLLVIALWGILLGMLGVLGYSVVSMLGSFVTIVGASYLSHKILVKLFRSAPSLESWFITALILFLILKPAQNFSDYSVLVIAAVIAVASKYVLTYNNRHIFNPAAVALVILGLLGSGEVFWWVGMKYIVPVAAVVGLLVVRKIRRFDVALTFLAFAILTYLFSRGFSIELSEAFKNVVLSGPLVFFASIMLVEPQTSPQTKDLRLVYAAIVGILFSLPFALPPLYSSPELSLIVGNIFAFLIGFKRRVQLEVRNVSPLGANVYEFSFVADHPFRFKAGQYLEWTLPHRPADNRGDRRYFTIASSPDEMEVRLVARIEPEHSSTFKRALRALQPGETITVSQLSGDFVLPRGTHHKLVFIAGGIGITPFRSMVQYMIDRHEQRDIVLYYTSMTADGFSYWELFNKAASLGVKPYYVLTGKEIPAGWAGKTGYLTAEQIKSEVPDYKSRYFYLSGPPSMVSSYKKVLRSAGVPSRHIRTDYFPGY